MTEPRDTPVLEHGHMPEGEETPPPGVRVMAILRWLLVLAMAAVAALSLARHYGLLTSTSAETQTLYQCPMHPTVVQDHPGECPICGMTLVPMEKAQAKEGESGHGLGLGHEGGGEAVYVCPMHPEVTSKDPNATCPICNMKLVPREQVEPEARAPTLSLSADRVQRMGVRTAKVTRASHAPQLVATGVVQASDARIARVHARVAGYVEELFVKERAALVRAGQPLLTLFSPELLAAERELITASQWAEHGHSSSPLAPSTGDLVTAAREKLSTLGVSEADVDAVLARGAPLHAITIRAPSAGFVTEKGVVKGSYVDAGQLLFEITDLSEVWVMVEVPQARASDIPVGAPVRLRIPGEASPRAGEVGFVYPTIDATQRTAEVRIKLKNGDLSLRPGTSAEATIALPAREGLYVPRSAIIDVGETQYAFVSHGGTHFEQAGVRVGATAGDEVEVLDGLEEGDEVVTSAAFLLDAETRLQRASGASAAPHVHDEKGASP